MNDKKELREYIQNMVLSEELSAEDIVKIKKVGHQTAKAVHKDKYDSKKAEKLISDLIAKGQAKGMGDDDISNWVQNAFRDEE